MDRLKKLLVTGSSGMLGSNLVHEIANKYDLYGINKGFLKPDIRNQISIDLTDKEAIHKIIKSVNPDFIVHCAALTDVDLCEENYTLARNTNAIGTQNLLSSFGPQRRIIYISTDSIFDGKQGNYTEMDLPSPINNYAKTKLEGEWFIEQGSNNYLIIRTNMFGWNLVKGQSFAEWIFKSLIQKRPIQMFTDVLFSPVSANTLCSYIEHFLNSGLVGRVNIGCDSAINKYDFGISLAKLFKLEGSLITPVSVEDFPFKAKRPKNTSLNLTKLKSIFGGDLPTIEDELRIFHDSSNEAKL